MRREGGVSEWATGKSLNTVVNVLVAPVIDKKDRKETDNTTRQLYTATLL